VIIDRIIESVERQQFLTKFGVEVFVADAAFLVFRGRGELVIAVRDDCT